MRAWKQAAILFIGFLLGAALMGVEMAAIRVMTPYFGSAIETWACMIATVMLAMMAGYYLGGMVADRMPRSQVLGGVVLVAGFFVLAVPFFATSMLDWMLQNLGYDPPAVLMASVALMFLPMMLLSFFSPFAVRLLLTDAQHGGRVAGSVYSITTIGNVVGTLGAPLYLMRFLGSRDIILTFAAVVIACGIALMALSMRARVDGR
ncbi:MAG: fused MFS/spermidine synthase [Gammaproteobacteria bacterium]